MVAAIPVVASIASSVLGSKAQSAAGKANAATNAAASDWLKELYSNTGEQEQPFIESGTTANKTIMDILTGGNTSAMDPFFNSSVYQFPLQQGLQKIGNSNAAKGLSNSTAALRNAGEYTQGLASQNFQQFLNNLFSLNTSGQQGIQTQTNAGAGVSGAMASIAGNQGQATGQAASAPWTGASTAIGSSGIGSFISNLFK